MRLVRSLSLLAPLSLLLFFALRPAEAITPTPSPTPTPDPFCQAASLSGGTRTVGVVEVTLPEGTYNILIPPPGTGGTGESNLVLCHKETGGRLSLNATNCAENGRISPNDDAGEVLDAIVESCRIAPTPTPQPPPQPCPEGDAVVGSQTVTIDDSIDVTLPPGDFLILVSNAVAQICNPSEEYMLALRLSDCGRPDIEPPNAPAHEVMSQIVASCTLLHPVTPAPTAPVITPPSTGNAGLRSTRN